MNHQHSTTSQPDTSSPLIYLAPDRLRMHPQNIRRYYPPQNVAKMAASIQAAGGVYQALLIVPADDASIYFVVDGNMRLAGGKSLGEQCPPLKCEVIEADHAAQLLAMTATSEFHFPKDPVSQGLHYRRLMEQEKLTIADIVEQTGISRPTIDRALKTLELEPEIQQWIVEGKLSADLRVTRALLELPDSATRLRLARRFARHETGIKGILQACRFAVRQAAQLAGLDAVQQLEAKQARKQQVAMKVLQGRTNGSQRPQLDPMAIGLINKAAERTLCDDCRLANLGEQCLLCPGPREFIDAVLEMMEAAAPAAQPAPAANGNGLAHEKERLAQLGTQLRADFRRAA